MCGIAGVVGRAEDYRELLLRAQNMQLHRGPDSQGMVQLEVNQCWRTGLAHQRLAIIDLSETGNQPMTFDKKEAWLIYNGEIYNYPELKQELVQNGWRFRGNSDTEVLYAAIQHWGIKPALQRLNGMWSFAWLDLKKQQLILCRDRLGIKPLFYCLRDGALFFASEIKTVLEMSGARFPLDAQVVGEYLIQSLLQSSTRTFFDGVYSLPAGSYAVIDLHEEQLKLDLTRYWRLDYTPRPDKEAVLIEETERLFFDAVRIRLRSDVPVGILLSGGIDSSSIAAAASAIKENENNIALLSAVSGDPRFDESPFIDIMARHLGKKVQKISMDFTAPKAMDLLGKICWYNDGPVGSFSNVAHYLLMARAKELGITVILSGQGADELLCGYRKYLGFLVQDLMRQGSYLTAARLLRSFWNQGTIIKQFNWSEAKRYLPHFLVGSLPDISGERLLDYAPCSLGLSKGMSIPERQMLDIEQLSIPALTHYEDRMSMGCSREIRVPFLDYRMVEFFINLPVNMKIHQGWTKYVFREAMTPYLPPAVAWRKDKQGFVNPQSEWIKNELKTRILKYFEEDALIFKSGLVKRSSLLQNYEAYCKQAAGKGQIWFRDIFNPLALEIWMREYERYIA